MVLMTRHTVALIAVKAHNGGKIDKRGGHVDKTTGKYHIHDYNKYYDKN